MVKPATDYGGKPATHSAANPPPEMVQNGRPKHPAVGYLKTFTEAARRWPIFPGFS